MDFKTQSPLFFLPSLNSYLKHSCKHCWAVSECVSSPRDVTSPKGTLFCRQLMDFHRSWGACVSNRVLTLQTTLAELVIPFVLDSSLWLAGWICWGIDVTDGGAGHCGRNTAKLTSFTKAQLKHDPLRLWEEMPVRVFVLLRMQTALLSFCFCMKCRTSMSHFTWSWISQSRAAICHVYDGSPLWQQGARWCTYCSCVDWMQIAASDIALALSYK